MRQFTVLIERDEDGVYVGHVPALPGCHTQAATLAELEERLIEAIGLCLEVAEAKGLPVESNDFVGVHRIEVA
ncbi:MAG: type II toxin-antitoxin system HicB family antitoxin [Myxococcota bacterium]|nr:type II toxin-antitoxin system HicB family antitoxin [Myxococcota bacterium]